MIYFSFNAVFGKFGMDCYLFGTGPVIADA